MCQMPVGKVLSVGKGRITISCNGRRRSLNSKLVKARKGDYVLFSLDMAIDKVDSEEAKAIIGSV